MIFSSLKAGFALAIHNWQLTVLLLFVSLALAVPVAIPFVSTIVQTTAYRLEGSRMLSDSIDPIWLIDFANGQFSGTSLEAFSTQVIVTFVVIAFGLLISNIVLAGGMLEVLLIRGQRFSMRAFFSGCGTYLWRFLRLWMISLVMYGGVFFVYLIVRAVIEGFEETSSVEWPILTSNWIATLLLAATFALVNMVFMYARISTVAQGASSMMRETVHAFRFVAQHLLKTSAVYASVLVIGFVLFGLFVGLRGVVSQNSLEMALLAWVVGQLAIAARLWTRVVSYAAGVELYRVLTPPSEAEPTIIKVTPEFASAIDSESAG